MKNTLVESFLKRYNEEQKEIVELRDIDEKLLDNNNTSIKFQIDGIPINFIAKFSKFDYAYIVRKEEDDDDDWSYENSAYAKWSDEPGENGLLKAIDICLDNNGYSLRDFGIKRPLHLGTNAIIC